MRGLLTLITASLNPTLINRGVLSLKKAADVKSGFDVAWSMGHFSTIKFDPAPASSATLITQVQDDLVETRSDTDDRDAIPLDEFVQRGRPSC